MGWDLGRPRDAAEEDARMMCPLWHVAAGANAWILTDEIIVK